MEEVTIKVDPIYEHIFEFLRVEHGMNRTEARRLLLDPRFIQCMNVEEEHHILMKNKEIAKRNVQIAEQKAQLSEQKAQLTEKDTQLSMSIRMLAQMGLSVEEISDKLKLSIETVKMAIV